MVLISAFHCSPRRHRETIREYDQIFPDLPHPAQWFGVYVFHDDFNHPTAFKGSFRRAFRVHWDHHPPHDLWQVGYCGPMAPDQFVENGMVLFESVTGVTLVSGNN